MSGRGARDIEGRLDRRMRCRGETPVQPDVKDELKVRSTISSADKSANRLNGLLSLSSAMSINATISFTITSSRTPCGFQSMRDKCLRNRTCAGSFKLPPDILHHHGVDPVKSLLDGVMRSSDRLVGSPLRQCVEQFDETSLVRITPGGFAIWLNPVGMLEPQVVVNLLPELGVGVDFVGHHNWLIWNVHLYSPPLS